MMLDDKQALISKLKKDLLSWQGVAQSLNDECAIDLGPLEKAFPNGIFPKGVIHAYSDDVDPIPGILTPLILVQGLSLPMT